MEDPPPFPTKCPPRFCSSVVLCALRPAYVAGRAQLLADGETREARLQSIPPPPCGSRYALRGRRVILWQPRPATTWRAALSAWPAADRAQLDRLHLPSAVVVPTITVWAVLCYAESAARLPASAPRPPNAEWAAVHPVHPSSGRLGVQGKRWLYADALLHHIAGGERFALPRRSGQASVPLRSAEVPTVCRGHSSCFEGGTHRVFALPRLCARGA